MISIKFNRWMLIQWSRCQAFVNATRVLEFDFLAQDRRQAGLRSRILIWNRFQIFSDGFNEIQQSPHLQTEDILNLSSTTLFNHNRNMYRADNMTYNTYLLYLIYLFITHSYQRITNNNNIFQANLTNHNIILLNFLT